jgi:chemotaxis methyl-accepting protein methylase
LQYFRIAAAQNRIAVNDADPFLIARNFKILVDRQKKRPLKKQSNQTYFTRKATTHFKDYFDRPIRWQKMNLVRNCY